MCTVVRWIFVHAHPPPLTHPPLFLTSPTLTPTGDTRGCGCRGHGCNFPDGRSLFETTAGAAVQGGGCRGDRSTRPPTSHGGEERRVGIGGRRTGEGKGEWQGGGCRGEGSARPATSHGAGVNSHHPLSCLALHPRLCRHLNLTLPPFPPSIGASAAGVA